MTSVAPTANERRSRPAEFGAAVATIMVKELRSRMRGRRAFVVLTIYLGVLALIAYGSYVVVAPTARQPAFDIGLGQSAVNASARIGQSMFAVLSLFQLLLVCFLAPAFTAGAISLEREKQTLDLLVSTPLRPGAIVIGKLLAALAFLFLMILAAIPLSALVLMYGGAAVDDIIRQQIVLLVTALGLGTVGVFWSAVVKRTQAATVLTYCSMLAFTIGTLLLFVFWTALATGGPDRIGPAPFARAPEPIVYPNPLVAMSDVIANTEPGGFGDFSRIISDLRGTRFGVGALDTAAASRPINAVGLRGGDRAMGDEPAAEPGLGAVAVPDVRTQVSGHFWPRFTITFIGLSLLLTLIAMRFVVPAGLRFALRRRPLAATMTTAIQLPGEGGPTIEEIEP